MQYELSTMYTELQRIQSEGRKPVSYRWYGIIHTSAVDLTIFKISSVDRNEDYQKWFAENLIIEAMVPFGHYVKIIYPSRSDLEITLTSDLLYELGGKVDISEDSISQRYHAVPVLEGLPAMESTEYDLMDIDTLNLRGIVNIRFQLIDRRIYKLHTVICGGPFRRNTLKDFIHYMLANESGNLRIDGESPIDGIDMVEPDNTAVREHIVIPQGTRLVDIPGYVNKHCGGVYNAGMGAYFKNNFWWIFPLYNVTRYETDTRRKLCLYKVPSRRSIGSERTYRSDGNTLHIVGTSDTQFKDDAGTKLRESGNGFRLTNPDYLLGEGLVVDNNKATIRRSKTTTEVATQSFNTPNFIPISPNRISINPFLDFAAAMAKEGGIYTLVWENSNPSLLIPGMATKIYYYKNDDLYELSGVLLCAQSYSTLKNRGFESDEHIQYTTLFVFVNRSTLS
jgi:hypothetical protein